MKILAIHSDHIDIELKKKAIKDAEDVSEKKQHFDECLVVLSSVEKNDEKNLSGVAARYVTEIENIAKQVNAKTLVLYPYVHLTSTPSAPKAALDVMKDAENTLRQRGFSVGRAPFGWYKAFEIACKGHPLSELSRQFGPEEEKKKGGDKAYKLSGKVLSEDEQILYSSGLVVAQAILELHAGANIAAIDFHNDQAFVDVDVPMKTGELEKIEARANSLLEGADSFEESAQLHHYQKDLAHDLGSTKGVQYKDTVVVPLYANTQVKSIKNIGVIKVLGLSSAYWRNNANNKQLSRIHYVAFADKKKLAVYMKRQEEAALRDHKLLGEQLGIYMISDLVGKGLPLWLPRGEILKRQVENFAVETEARAGYVRVSTPHLAKEKLFQTSGHLPHYEADMYPAMQMDDGKYYLKGMNCPLHHVIFNHKPRSYRELPLRIAEYGTVYRNELSGTLSGLLRVRMLSMNDAHIYCTKEQIKQEVEGVVNLVKYYYEIFGFKEYYFRLSLWDPKNKDKYIDEPENWQHAETALRQILKDLKLPFVEAKDEAAFYGPKIDIQFKAVTGREETMSTIQLDFAAKKRFNFSYADKDGSSNKEVFVIHRAPLSVHERFVAFLIEHYAGRFPLWLNPEQVRIVTVTDRADEYARKILGEFTGAGIRATLDESQEKIGKKVRDAQLLKINYLVTIGDKEIENGTIAVRTREGELKFGLSTPEFIASLLDEIKTRRR